ncbi:MAG: hypothetical protein K2G45_03105 [Lachnospiraceae bacterium]|nr:hypothetical protein [Lachnospiraceae bacterium]
MDKRDNKIVIFNRDIKINVATVLILAVLIYVLISLFIASRKDPITTYKVNKSSINNNIQLEGLAIRDEQIITSDKSGYICYYIRDGEKVKKNSTVCTIDETGQVYDTVIDSENMENILKTEDYEDIRSLISLYKVGYKDVNFYSAYNFQTDVNNKVLELSNEVLMQEIKNGNNNRAILSAVNSPYSGLVTYYTDGFESFDMNSVSKKDYDKSEYNKQTLKTGDIISANKPIVKIIPNEEWNIIAPVTEEQIRALSEKTKIRFSINNSSYKVIMPFEIFTGSDGSYINIKIDKFLSNFINERYLSIEIFMEEESGLKVPVSSIVEKEVYKVPIDFFTAGGNQSSTNRLNLQSTSEDGERTIKQIAPTIYKTDEEYCLIDPSSLDTSDVLYNINTNKTLAVSVLETTKLKGVYSANRGTAEFKVVNIIKTIDEFALIESDGTLKIYDNIILDSSSVKENQIIY